LGRGIAGRCARYCSAERGGDWGEFKEGGNPPGSSFSLRAIPVASCSLPRFFFFVKSLNLFVKIRENPGKHPKVWPNCSLPRDTTLVIFCYSILQSLLLSPFLPLLSSSASTTAQKLDETALKLKESGYNPYIATLSQILPKANVLDVFASTNHDMMPKMCAQSV